MSQAQDECQQFLSVADQFKLGLLMTEMQHPLTKDLSELSKNDIDAATALCNEVDIGALNKLKRFERALMPFIEDVQKTLNDGSRVFFVGCGATGRLSLCLESWWRRMNPGNNQVRGILAGGDLALIHSLEKAEDYPEFGKRHLIEANIKPNDLVVGFTEGGETSYVIGAVEFASSFCESRPYILYCNEDPILEMVAKRSAAFISNEDIINISLPIGPMTLSGSTRMQASTVLQLIGGLSLLGEKKLAYNCDRLINQLLNSERAKSLTAFITFESNLYNSGGHLTYCCSPDLGMTILTDTTERAPTFGVCGLENRLEASSFSLANISIDNGENPTESFKMILGREAHPLEWEVFNNRAGKERLRGFDLSEENAKYREMKLDKHENVKIQRKKDHYEINAGEESIVYKTPFNADSLLDLIDYKMFLNTHSTLVMGRLGRFESNVMTWVRPNNYKLIDRTIRYASMLLEEKKQSFEYEEMAKCLFELKNDVSEKESVVMKLAEKLRGDD